MLWLCVFAFVFATWCSLYKEMRTLAYVVVFMDGMVLAAILLGTR